MAPLFLIIDDHMSVSQPSPNFVILSMTSSRSITHTSQPSALQPSRAGSCLGRTRMFWTARSRWRRPAPWNLQTNLTPVFFGHACP